MKTIPMRLFGYAIFTRTQTEEILSVLEFELLLHDEIYLDFSGVLTMSFKTANDLFCRIEQQYGSKQVESRIFVFGVNPIVRKILNICKCNRSQLKDVSIVSGEGIV